MHSEAEVEASQTPGYRHGFFGLSGSSGRVQNSDPYDYEQRFPEDAYGAEMKSNARVWRTYIQEAFKFDAELTTGWNQSAEVLLVFAGLFSAVVTTFLVETMGSLSSPNPAILMLALLEEQIRLQRALSDGTPTGTVPAASDSSSLSLPSHADVWVNALWFTSLTLSLSAALMCVLVKQWIQNYTSVSSGTAHEQARIRHFRYMGLEAWRVPSIIGWLPVLLHAALLLFFAGMVILLTSQNTVIAWIVGVTTGAVFLAYIGFNTAPLFDPQCPYTTSVTTQLYRTYVFIIAGLRSLQDQAFRFQPHYQNRPRFHETLTSTNLKRKECTAVNDATDEIDAEALVWLHTSSSNPSVSSIVVQAISGLPRGFRAKQILESASLDRAVLEALRSQTYSSPGRHATDVKPRKLERLARAREQLPSWFLRHEDQLIGGRLRGGKDGWDPQDPLVALGVGFSGSATSPQTQLDLPQMQQFLNKALETTTRLHWVAWEGFFGHVLAAAQTSVPVDTDTGHGLRFFSVLPSFVFASLQTSPVTSQECMDPLVALTNPDHPTAHHILRYLFLLLSPSRPVPSPRERIPAYMFVSVVNTLLERCCDANVPATEFDMALPSIVSKLLTFVNSFVTYIALAQGEATKKKNGGTALVPHSHVIQASLDVVQPLIMTTMVHLHRLLSRDCNIKGISHTTIYMILEVFHIIFTHSLFADRRHSSMKAFGYPGKVEGFMDRLIWLVSCAPTSHPPSAVAESHSDATSVSPTAEYHSKSPPPTQHLPVDPTSPVLSHAGAQRRVYEIM